MVAPRERLELQDAALPRRPLIGPFLIQTGWTFWLPPSSVVAFEPVHGDASGSSCGLFHPVRSKLTAGGRLCGRPPRVKGAFGMDCHVGCRFVSGLFARPMAAGLDGLFASRGS